MSDIPGLKPVKINDLLYRILPLSAKINDQKLRGINTFLCRALGPLICTLDSFILSEQNMMKNTVVSHAENGIMIGDHCINVKQIRQWLHQSIQLLSCANSVILVKRHSQIKGFLGQQYQHLLKPSNKITDFLLGDDLENKITESSKIRDVSQKLSRKHGNGRTYNPRYQRGNYRGNYFRKSSHRGKFTQARGGFPNTYHTQNTSRVIKRSRNWRGGRYQRSHKRP